MKTLLFISLCGLLWYGESYAQDEDQNHVISYRPRQIFTDASQIHRFTAPKEVQKTITYTDGTGRTTKSISMKGSPNQNDIVQRYEYDKLGRTTKMYLPYEERGNGIAGYYQDSKPYTVTEYEPSPLGRKVSEIGPGQAWHDNNKRRYYTYRTNNSSDAVKKLSISASPSLSPVPTLNGTYADGQLSVVETVDEDGIRTVTYTNKSGQSVMKKVQTEERWLYTYHAYDVLGNLRFTLPPKAMEQIGNTFLGSTYLTTLAELAFQYVYDDQQRLIYEKAPGVAPVQMIYDRLDRLVLSQNGEQARQNQWSFIKYDRFSRPIMTGSYTSALSRSALINEIDKLGFYEERTESAIGYTFNQSYPAVLEEGLRTITYYDDYDFINYNGWDQEAHAYDYNGTDKLTRPVGQVTGAKTKVIGTDQWLNSVSYYNDRYEVVYSVSENHQGGVDKISNRYDFSGNLMSSHHTHNDDLTIVEGYTYDHANRLFGIGHLVNNEGAVKLVLYSYSGLGEMLGKNLYSTSVYKDDYLQYVDYKYNIRGWLESINSSTLDNPDQEFNGDLFGMELLYHQNQWNLPEPSISAPIQP